MPTFSLWLQYTSARVREVALPIHPRLAHRLPCSMLIQHWQVSGLLTGSLRPETEPAWPFTGTAECELQGLKGNGWCM